MAYALAPLRTQFDVGRAVSVAGTPSGACCSCCCCCAASLLATSGYTAFTLGRLARQQGELSPAPAPRARIGVGTAIAAGALVPPAAALAGLVVGAVLDTVVPLAFSVVLPLVAWAVALVLLFRRVGDRLAIARSVAIVVAAIGAFWAEFVGGLAAAEVLGAYVLGGLVLGLALVVVEYFLILRRP